MNNFFSKIKNSNFLRDHKQHVALFIVLGGGAVIALTFQVLLSSPSVTSAETSVPRTAKATEPKDNLPNPFEGIVLEARSAFVADMTNGQILFSKEADEKLALASITKLMTALVARDYSKPEAVVTLTKGDLSLEQGGGAGLRVGEQWKLGDLLDATLMISSNDGARAIGRFIGAQIEQGISEEVAHERFIAMMNEKARTLGLLSMEFHNESGLDLEDPKTGVHTAPGALGSARDVAVLTAKLWQAYPEVLEVTRRKDAKILSQDNIPHVLINTNTGLGQYPGMLGSKTGYTLLAGGNLTIVFDIGIGHPVVAVVLGSSMEGRFLDMKKLVQATLDTYSR